MRTEDIAIHFADQLCRTRALTTAESDMLRVVVMKERPRMTWTPEDDQVLRRLSASLPAYAVAEQMGRTPWAIRNRTRRLKQREFARG
ncbi:hypothetical protein [Sphingomonas sp. R86520]|uniref:hypothetical protein n=1 Tax=Sphingomonas sp. R86520 TaxID=3093859 RepID=UPI0036D424C0